MNENWRVARVTGVKGDLIMLEDERTLIAYVSDEIIIGQGVMLSPGLEIGFPDKPVRNLVIGDHSRIYGGQIACRDFTCGDYVTLHEGFWIYGRHDVVIGHNCWFGRRCTLDAEGGVWIGNGLGAGQDSHMWSHIRHGDTLVGNRWLKYGEFRCGDDVWLTGRCTSAPAEHADRSMAMVESNLTKGMPENTIWGGNPAKDLTDKLGAPFVEVPPADRLIDFNERLDRFQTDNPDVDLMTILDLAEAFDVTTRTYQKTNHPYEVRLMRFLLPEAKFVPRGNEHVA